jgi:hypothetical protein
MNLSPFTILGGLVAVLVVVIIGEFVLLQRLPPEDENHDRELWVQLWTAAAADEQREQG